MTPQLQLKHCLTTFISLWALVAYSQNIGDTFTDNHISFRVTTINPNTVTVTDYTGGSSVTIPQTVDNNSNTFAVTAIGVWAFNSKQLTSVEIPNSVTSIGNFAFADNQLTNVTIPNGLTRVANYVFDRNQLVSVTIPNSVTSIGNYAFHNSQLTSVEIPNGVTNIEIGAFENNQLTSVEIPNNVTSIGRTAFRNNRLSSVEIPNGVTSIGSFAFNVNQLIHVTIPKNVTTIGASVFQNNPNLVTMFVEASNPSVLSSQSYAFYNPDRNQIDLIVPKGRKQAYLSNGWTGFKSITEMDVDELLGETFTNNSIEYQITATSPDKEVTIINYTGTGGAVTIPQTVNHALNTFTVMAIGFDAYKQCLVLKYGYRLKNDLRCF